MRERPRRLRRTAALREMVAETRVAAEELIQPHFVLPDPAAEVPIESLPGIARMGTERLLAQVERDLELGIRTALLFGVVEGKDAMGTAGEDPNGPVPTALRALRRRFGADLTLIADVCLCTYTDHGHCGVVRDDRVINDPSLALLAAQSVTLAEAGADVIAPSDMMDGRVRAIRDALDQAGFEDRAILSYAAKYASNFYGPFREAADSAPRQGAGPRDRKSYQMDYRNGREAVREASLDLAEGADIVMVKPALAYLDVIAQVRAVADRPVAAYLVSGEYAAVEALAEKGLAARGPLVHEHLHAVRRAGADLLITYHARAALQNNWLGVP
ncbi:MAG: porphobilinogen synthase [Planctomycetota bacterium]